MSTIEYHAAKHVNRRDFLRTIGAAAAGASVLPAVTTSFAKAQSDMLFKISLAEWSVNQSIFAGSMDHLEFAQFASGLGIKGVEYVNQFFKDKAEDRSYLDEMNRRATDAGVENVLIMVDQEGALGHSDETERVNAVEQHKKWVEAARVLGCPTIRVNGYGADESVLGDFDESMKLVADGLRRLCQFSESFDVDVVIENHGGWSSHGAWLAGVIRLADHPRAGTLPDFGNFRIGEGETYDSYRGVEELMPYARGVSVKPTVYDAYGNRLDLDYARMMSIVLDAGYRGYCGIEHGREGTEAKDIARVKAELESVRERLSVVYL
jgi:sugar phosphate isomerase/epimerase